MSAVYDRSFRPMPAVPELELVPKAEADQGFAGRLPPVTEAERLAADRALNAKKATAGYYDLSDNFALQEQNGRAS